MSFDLKTHYQGTTLVLEIDSTPSARLRINGILRDQVTSDTQFVTIRLSSTVQTGYEWHEYIEGLIEYSEGTIKATLNASNVTLISRTFDVETSH